MASARGRTGAKILLFVLLLLTTFLAGFILLPEATILNLIIISLINSFVLFFFLYGISGLFSKSIARKILASLIILLFAFAIYSDPSIISQKNVNTIYSAENSFLSSLESATIRTSQNYQNSSSFSVASSTVSSTQTSENQTLNNPTIINGNATISYPESYQTLANYALSLINKDRERYGLQPVTLSNVPSGQQHADSMLYFNYFSHWDTQGYKPYMRYTLLGGKGAVAENIAKTYCTNSPVNSTLLEVSNCNLNTIENALRDSEWDMMYNDLACCNNGHRDNILDPLHNRVSIGIAYNTSSSVIYFVEDFENYYINLTTPVLGSQNTVTIQGTMSRSFSIKQLVIFYDQSPQPMTTSQLDSTFAYDPGTFAGGVLPPCFLYCSYYPNGVTVYASIWEINSNQINIKFSLSDFIKSYGLGVYTLYLQTGNNTTTAILMYSIFVGS